MVTKISTENTLSQESEQANSSLKRMVQLLFAIGVIGQGLFVIYIVAFYGGVVVNGTYEKVNERLVHGIIAGDRMGNAALAVHLFLAAIITFFGPLQFIASIRNRFQNLHRWIGRIYFVTAFLISGAGLLMIYSRGAIGGLTGLLGNTLNATLIMSFAVLAWLSAINKNFGAHKKWAIRTFLMVSGVWFFRIGYGLWILLSGFTAVGTTPDMTGPIDIFLSFGHSLVPLAILEFYFFAKSQTNPSLKRRASVFFFLLGVLLTAGIGMVAYIFWLPAMS